MYIPAKTADQGILSKSKKYIQYKNSYHSYKHKIFLDIFIVTLHTNIQ